MRLGPCFSSNPTVSLDLDGSDPRKGGLLPADCISHLPPSSAVRICCLLEPGESESEHCLLTISLLGSRSKVKAQNRRLIPAEMLTKWAQLKSFELSAPPSKVRIPP